MEQPWVARPAPRPGRLRRVLAPLAATGAFLAKFGAVLVKVKSLAVVATMLLSVAGYTLLYGWRFAVGLVLLIFVHEMGHVLALRRRGVPSSLPLFVPFLGAFVSMKQMPSDAYVEAETALAGPAVGALGALAVLVAAHVTGSSFLLALAFVGFLVNLFNLLPALPLDGGRAAAALHPAIWLLGLLALLGYEVLRPSPVIPIILVLGGVELARRWRGRGTPAGRAYFAIPPGRRAAVAVAYLGLVAALVVGLHHSYVPHPL